jgi:hypothetical protein
VILESLTALFLQRSQHEKRAQVCLWFDEKGEFARLLPEFESSLAQQSPPPFRLLAYDPDGYHGQIWIRHQIHQDLVALPKEFRNQQRFVVYLPLSEERLEKPDKQGRNHLELLAECRISGLLLRINGKHPSLFSFLRQAGVGLPDDPAAQRKLWDGGRDSLPPRQHFLRNRRLYSLVKV